MDLSFSPTLSEQILAMVKRISSISEILFSWDALESASLWHSMWKILQIIAIIMPLAFNVDPNYKPYLLGIEHFTSMLTWKYLGLLGFTLKMDFTRQLNCTLTST